jgi:hypothetical protein
MSSSCVNWSVVIPIFTPTDQNEVTLLGNSSEPLQFKIDLASSRVPSIPILNLLTSKDGLPM